MTSSHREVLIVEDDLQLQHLLAAVASRNGLVPVLADDGRKALSLLASTDFGAVVLDLMLPVQNGFDVLRQLSTMKPDLIDRTIIITGADERTYRNSPHVRHTHAILRKPFDVAQLQQEMLACCAAGSH